jgi:hypothetical protein
MIRQWLIILKDFPSDLNHPPGLGFSHVSTAMHYG